MLIACEFSGVVRDAFRARGHNAWSCDLLATEREQALEFVQALYTAPVPRIAIENPRGLNRFWRPADQVIQPWMFGHGETKATCLWLKNLPPLLATSVDSGRTPRVFYESPGPERWKNRSRTLEGVASAMAEQWG